MILSSACVLLLGPIVSDTCDSVGIRGLGLLPAVPLLSVLRPQSVALSPLTCASGNRAKRRSRLVVSFSFLLKQITATFPCTCCLFLHLGQFPQESH